MNIPPLNLSKHITTAEAAANYLPTPPTSPENDDPTTSQKRKLLHDDNEQRHEPNSKRPFIEKKLDLSLLDLYLSSGKSLAVKDEQYGLNLLCWACQCKSIEALVKILQLGDIDLNERQGPYGLTALHIAAKLNFIEGIEALIQHPNLDLNQQDVFGLTALHYTARSDYNQATKLLLDSGACLDRVDKRGKLPIHHAIRNASVALIQMILTKKERNNPSGTNMIWFTTPVTNYCAMQEAIIITGNRTIVKELLDSGAFVPFDKGGWWQDKYETKRNELVGLCVYWNRLDCLMCLLEDELFKSELKSSWCQRALELAVQQRKLDFVIYLCQDLHVNPCYANGHNAPLLYAVNHGFMDMIPYLLIPETSSACIQQAVLYSRLIGKEAVFLDLLKSYLKPEEQPENCA